VYIYEVSTRINKSRLVGFRHMQRGYKSGIPVPTVYQFKKKQVPRNGLQESAILEEV
jgi:tRNA A-37 threonylcarbamoyl transferase component Bud32